MKIIDRYILWSFIQNLILWYITLVGLYIIVDLFSNIDSFFNSDNGGNPFVVMTRYYFFHLFPIVDMISASTILVSALTVMATMIRRNEMIALMSSGVSKMRVVRPIFCATVVYLAIFFLTKEIVLPNYKAEFVKTPKEIAQSDLGIKVKRYQDSDSKIWLDGERLFLQEQRIENPTLTFPIDFHIPQNVLKAKEAVYRPATETRPAGYLLTDIEQWNEILEQKTISTVDRRGKLFLYPPGEPNGDVKANQCFVVSGIVPEVLATGDEWVNYASTFDLIKAFQNQSFKLNHKRIETQIHSRIVNPISNLVPLFLGLPIIFLRSNRNMIQSIAIGAALAGLFLGFQYVCQFFGIKFNSPILAAWAPILLFVPIATTTFASLTD